MWKLSLALCVGSASLAGAVSSEDALMAQMPECALSSRYPLNEYCFQAVLNLRCQGDLFGCRGCEFAVFAHQQDVHLRR